MVKELKPNHRYKWLNSKSSNGFVIFTVLENGRDIKIERGTTHKNYVGKAAPGCTLVDFVKYFKSINDIILVARISKYEI